LAYFIEKIESEFTKQTETELKTKTDAVREHCRKRIDLELSLKRAEIREVEEYYAFIRALSPEERKNDIENKVKYCYDSAWCLIDFDWKVKVLEGKLKQVKQHFPESRPTIEALLETLKSIKGCYKNGWETVKWVGKILSLVATGGLSNPEMAPRFKKWVPRLQHSEKAVELVFYNWEVNWLAFRDIRENEEPFHLRPQAKGLSCCF